MTSPEARYWVNKVCKANTKVLTVNIDSTEPVTLRGGSF